MALSRLRHPLISRAPSLFKARFLSSSRSLARSSSNLDADRSLLRPTSLSMVSGVHDDSSLKLKMRIGVRHFSSSGSENDISLLALRLCISSFANGLRGMDCTSSTWNLEYQVQTLNQLNNIDHNGLGFCNVHNLGFYSQEPSHTVVGMPALSPTMTQGNITKWHKKEGDKIGVGDVLCEIETDKATLEFETLEEGFLAKILVPEGSKDVPVGQAIAITSINHSSSRFLTLLLWLHKVEDADDIQNVPATVGSGSEVKEEKSTGQDVKALSPTMNQGNIAIWRKKEGDKIEVGDVLCEIETDKATLEFETLEEGYLAKILAPEGSKDVAVGQPIAVTVEDSNDIEAVKTSVSSGSSKNDKEEKSTHHGSKGEASEAKASFKKISPSAKLLISEHGLDAPSLQASGPYGTLLKSDVLAAIKSGKGRKSSTKEKGAPPPQKSPQPSGTPLPESKQSDSFEDLPNTQIRKMCPSDVILDPLLSFRKELKEQHDVKVSVNDIVIKAVAIALRNVPQANDQGLLAPLHQCMTAHWNAEKGEIILWDSVDISIAVATEKGLMTPIVKNADQKSISAISSEVKQLAEKARAGKLAPNEFQGGSFSISNLGMYPVDQFAAIINPPRAI
ncbi:unnamed protein product [Dovyalis caffra]|uniref:Dihydrolipoamide acetyltransferase component of pyruvate dehydrogenase complex n=1 Tax=Dovyalis caffra TaxID=77055 RepID=A0AAV1QV48_9ROSI|nr:unnamed protein product [Dovyalis caffra]